MCLPLAAVAVVATVAAGAVSAYGSYAQGQAEKKANQYSADVATRQQEINTQTANQNITLVQGEAAEASKISRRNAAQVAGEQKGVLAAQGVGGGSVTAADIASSTFDTALLDQQAIRYNAESKTYALKNNLKYENWDLENQKNQYLMAGKNAERAGNIKAVSSLLSTASSVANTTLMNKYYQNRSVV